jgi:hypothetical protein
MHPDAWRTRCGPERRSDPSAPQRTVGFRFLDTTGALYDLANNDNDVAVLCDAQAQVQFVHVAVDDIQDLDDFWHACSNTRHGARVIEKTRRRP